MSAVKFIDVVKIYGKGEGKQVAVEHVSFTIEKGEFVVILGQSGAGKSTVLNMLGGIMSKARYGDMQKFVKELYDEGYEIAELIDTTDGTFMSKVEAKMLGLSGSSLLVGRK